MGFAIIYIARVTSYKPIFRSYLLKIAKLQYYTPNLYIFIIYIILDRLGIVALQYIYSIINSIRFIEKKILLKIIEEYNSFFYNLSYSLSSHV